MAKLKVHLVVIDPQNDFMDLPDSSLPVSVANADMDRVAKMVNRIGHKLDDIHVTMDSHRMIDVESGIWTPRNPAFRSRMLDYTKALKDGGKYVLCIWPTHCLIGTWGHNIHGNLNGELQRWSEKEFAMVDYVTKGSNPWTEHYGALQAEVPDPSDPGTGLNTGFLNMLAAAVVVCLAVLFMVFGRTT
jgi:nicotinamidase-related amidase